MRKRDLLLTFFIVFGIATLIFTFFLRDRYVVPIITYHNVTDGKNALNNVTPASFAVQMKFLKKHYYNVISFDDYVLGTKKGRAFGRNTVVIHFDDGYEDNYTNAFPILKTYRFPASIFIVSDSVGTPNFITWDQIKEMEKHDIEFGSHTRRHAYLPDVSYELAVDEIVNSKKIIEDRLGHPIKYFVYPSGGFSESVEGIVMNAGYEAAATTNRGTDTFNRNLFELNRVRIKDKDNSFVLWAKVSGYYNLFRRPRCGKDCRKE